MKFGLGGDGGNHTRVLNERLGKHDLHDIESFTP